MIMRQAKNIKKNGIFGKIINLFKDKNFLLVFYVFLALKILVIGLAVGSLLIPQELTTKKHHLDDTFLNLFAQYDSSSYLDIAKNGYNEEFSNGVGNYSYFPLYPALIKLFSFIFGFGWAAFIISNILSFFCIFIFYLLIKEEFNERIEKKTVLYFLFFPVAYFFTMMYTESLFFLLILLMFYYARYNNWLLVGIFGFFASLTRMFGILMFAPMIFIYYKNKGILFIKNGKFNKQILKNVISKTDWKVLYLFLIPLGILLFFSYFYFSTGNFFKAFETFRKPEYSFEPAFPFVSFVQAFIDIFRTTSSEAVFYLAINIFLGILFGFAAIFSYKIKWEYFFFMVPYYLLAISHTGVSANIRYFWLMFPAYILAARIKNRFVNNLFFVLTCIFFLLLILFTVRHVNDNVNFFGLLGLMLRIF